MVAKITERIPHNRVAYAYLEIEAGSANEFEALRSAALKALPHYGFATSAPKDSGATVPEAGAEQGEPSDARVAPEKDTAAQPAPAPTSEGLSPRDKARAKMAAKKEGK